MTKIISVLNQKGGVGKTTTSVNLGVGLANKGYKTLLIDFDPQGNATDHVIQSPSLYIDTLLEVQQLDTVIPEDTFYNNLFVISSRLELALAERNLMLNVSTANHNRLKRIIKSLDKQYDYIIIDCPPILNLLVVNALCVSDEVIIPIKIDKGAEKGFEITMQNIEQIRENYELDIDVRVLFTMVNRNLVDKTRISELREQFPSTTLSTTIRTQNKPVAQAGYQNDAVINTKTNVGLDYQNLVSEILDKDLHGHDVHVRKEGDENGKS